MFKHTRNIKEQIQEIFAKILGRPPTEEELTAWLEKLQSGDIDFQNFIAALSAQARINLETETIATEADSVSGHSVSFDIGLALASASATGTVAATGGTSMVGIAVGGLAVAAAAGGGGGGGGGNSNVQTFQAGPGIVKELKRDYIASIDLRFDQPTDRVSAYFDSAGHLVNSFENVRRHVDMAKSRGFTAIELDINVPIDNDTGKIQLRTPDGTPNPDKSLPDDLWRIITYAESQGLDTSLRLNIVDALYDTAMMLNQVGRNFDIEEFFRSVRSYEMMIARDAQYHGVDQLVIGSMNFGFDTAFRTQWQSVVDGIRSVYQGELAYETAYQLDDIVVWDLVDNVALTFQPNLGAARDTAAEIAPLYLQSVDRSDWGVFNPYQTVVDVTRAYPTKDVMLYSIAISPIQPGLGETINVHDVVYADNDILDLNNLDLDLMRARYAGFLEFFNNHLDDKIDAVQFFQFAPWADADWIRNPTSETGQAYNAYARGGYFFNYQPEALDILDDYLIPGWGSNYLALSGSNDVVSDLFAPGSLQNFLA